jgi:hypothetical protein
MSADRIVTSGVLGGPPRPAHGDVNKRDLLVFGHDAARCPTTGRFFENGSGALPRNEQTAMFLREQAIEADRPKEGDSCPQTGRAYECGVGALSKTRQTEIFLGELSPAAKAQRQASANALAAIEPAGRA